MRDFGIIDTHVHLWDPCRLSYSWQRGNHLLHRPYLVEDYRRDTRALNIEAMVFLECDVDRQPGFTQSIMEMEFVREQALRDPRIRGLVPAVPVEWGSGIALLLEELLARFPTVKGVRRIVQFHADPRALMLSSAFIQGVNLLEKYGLHFEVTVDHTQMDIVLEFVKHIPRVPLVLDHCGKPGIREGYLEQYQRQISALVRYPNVMCKLSGLAVEASPQWTEAELRPYIEATVNAFGIDRVMYGGDWPVCLQATSLQHWVNTLDTALAGLSSAELRKIYRDNANRFYRLGI